MEQHKTRTYLLYAVGEIALVMIGILLALQINNWNEDQKLDQVSRVTMENLETELHTAKEALGNIVQFNNDILQVSDLFINDALPTDSIRKDPGIVFNFTNYITVTIDLPILTNELSSERKIQDEQALTIQLRSIKDDILHLEETLFYLDEFWNSQVAPYFIKTRTMIVFNKYFQQPEVPLPYSSIQELAEGDEYKNLAAMANLFTRWLNEDALQANASIDEALALIEESK